VASRPGKTKPAKPVDSRSELVIITGLSGSGKGTVLKALEDLGYYAVDNLPLDFIPKFAELIGESKLRFAAIVVDVREGDEHSRDSGTLAGDLWSRDQRIIDFGGDGCRHG